MRTDYSSPIVTLNDLNNERINKTIGSFNYFLSAYGLEPFKLISIKNSILISRFGLEENIFPMMNEHYFLSIMLVNTSIETEEINAFIENRTSIKRSPDQTLDKIKTLLRTGENSGCESGKNWAKDQARLGLRLLLSLARDAGIEVRSITEYDKDHFNDILGINSMDWKIFSVLDIRMQIQKTPDSLLKSTYGLN